MKKLLLLIPFLGLSFLAHAQSGTYHAFKVDITLGYAIPQDGGSGLGNTVKAGATFTIEPHYRLSDAIAIGFRIEGAGLGYENEADENSSAKVSILSSYCPSLEYYFTNGGFRPFIGGGAGIFDQSSINIDENTGDTADFVKQGSKFGFFPRAGFEAGHFRMSAEYNILGKNANYAAFKLGFFFGGGKK